MIQWWWLIIEFVVLVLFARAIPAALIVCAKRAHIKREKEEAGKSFVSDYTHLLSRIGKDLEGATGLDLGYTGTGSQPGGVSFVALNSSSAKKRILGRRDG